MSETMEPTTKGDLAEERKKPHLESILFCDFYNSTDDGKTNLLGIFDRIYIHPDKNITPRFTLFIRTAETIKDHLLINIYDPNGGHIETIQYGEPIFEEFTPNLPAHIQLIYAMRFVPTVEGAYWFDVSYKQKSLGGAAITVEFRETENKAGGTDTYI